MDQATAMGPAAVEAIELTSNPLVGDIVANGLVRGAREVTVVSETQGIIEQVRFALGDRLRAGDLLVSLDDTIQALAVDEARESVAAAELDVEAARRLVSSGNASQVELTRARTTLAGARARLAQAQKALNDRTIEAPIAGLVASTQASVQAGNTISNGTPVARIVDTSELEIMLSLGEREIQYVAAGSSAFVTISAAGAEEIVGSVHAIAAGSDQATGSFPVLVRWANTLGSQARSGLSASVRIPPSGAPESLTVPANAIVNEGGERFVYVATDAGFARKRRIETGARSGNRVVVTAGVDVGEHVIVSGIGGLADGTRVATTLPVSGQ